MGSDNLAKYQFRHQKKSTVLCTQPNQTITVPTTLPVLEKTNTKEYVTWNERPPQARKLQLSY